MKHSTLCAIAAWTLCTAGAAPAAPVLLDFEGLKDFETVNGFYNGGTGSLGSTGLNLGVQFNDNGIAVIDSDAGGSGNFANEPSASTVLAFQQGNPVMSVAAGFTGSLSFFFATNGTPIFIQIFDGLNATGNLLALNGTSFPGNSCGGDPNGDICLWLPFTMKFDGTAKSVLFGGTAAVTGYDDIRFNTVDPAPLPEPATPLLAGLALLGAAVASRRRHAAQT